MSVTLTPTTETTAAQLLEAQAQIHEQMAERRRALAAMITDAQAELAMLDGKPAPKLKAKPGPKIGSKRRQLTLNGKVVLSGTAPQMPMPAMEPNAAQNEVA